MALDSTTPTNGFSKGGLFPGVRGTPLGDLFPAADYRHQMRFQRGTVAGFFQNWSIPVDLIEQRKFWLQRDPASYAAAGPEAGPLLEEMKAEMKSWSLRELQLQTGDASDPQKSIAALGEVLEPDLLLLKHDADGILRLYAGCVCFPSSWSLSEKMGRPLDWIHQVVPGLNQQLGSPIDAFLRRLAPGIAWLRANWSLSRSAELNQHPDRKLPRLEASVRSDEVWLRVEHQALVKLPATGGVLFGIRVVVHSLDEIRRNPAAAVGLQRALETMPEEMARYKGIAPARQSVIKLLTEVAPK